VERARGAEEYGRLRAVKASCDPENLFRAKLSVAPATRPAARVEVPA
jgi:hypothetical protein